MVVCKILSKFLVGKCFFKHDIIYTTFLSREFGMRKLLIGVLLQGLCMSSTCFAANTKPLPDGEARDLMIRGNISAFQGECPCPYSPDTKSVEREPCGENSFYNQNPGSIKCYAGDISDEELKQFRNQYQIEEPKLPWDKDKKPGY